MGTHAKLFSVAVVAALIVNGAMASPMKMQQGITYQIIEFKGGSAELTDMAKNHLRNLFDHAKATGKNYEAHIAVWADREKPEGRELKRSDRQLAERRSKAIERYLEETLGFDEAETYEMTEANHEIDADHRRVIDEGGGAGRAVVVMDFDSHAEGVSSRRPASGE